MSDSIVEFLRERFDQDEHHARPQYVMAYDIKGFGVVGYEPFIRPVGAAVDQFACTGC